MMQIWGDFRHGMAEMSSCLRVAGRAFARVVVADGCGTRRLNLATSVSPAEVSAGVAYLMHIMHSAYTYTLQIKEHRIDLRRSCHQPCHIQCRTYIGEFDRPNRKRGSIRRDIRRNVGRRIRWSSRRCVSGSVSRQACYAAAG
jgi:hypothetical protein